MIPIDIEQAFIQQASRRIYKYIEFQVEWATRKHVSTQRKLEDG